MIRYFVLGSESMSDILQHGNFPFLLKVKSTCIRGSSCRKNSGRGLWGREEWLSRGDDCFYSVCWAESSYDTLTHREQARPDAQMGDAQRASCCKVKCPLSPCLREPDINCTASPVIPLPIKLLLFESYQLECFFSGKDQTGLGGCSHHWKGCFCHSVRCPSRGAKPWVLLWWESLQCHLHSRTKEFYVSSATFTFLFNFKKKMANL